MAAFSLCNQISKLLLISRFYAGADVTSYRNPTSWCSGVCIIPQQIARFRLWKGNFIHVHMHESFEFFNTDRENGYIEKKRKTSIRFPSRFEAFEYWTVYVNSWNLFVNYLFKNRIDSHLLLSSIHSSRVNSMKILFVTH